MTKLRKRYAVRKVHSWDTLTEGGNPIRVNFKSGMPVGFLPVFATREDAEEWAWPGEVIEVIEARED